MSKNTWSAIIRAMETQEKVPNVFRNRNFVLVFFGALFSNSAAMLYSFAASYYILAITNNNSVTQGLYLGVTGIVFTVLAPLGGVVADRSDKAKIMYICDFIKGALILATALLMYLFNENQTQLVIMFVFGILGQIASAFFAPASSSLLPRIVGKDQLLQANSYNAAMLSVETIAGILLAGILYSALPITTLFTIVGIGYVISGVTEMFIRWDFRKSGTPLTLKTALTDMSDGLKYMVSMKAIFTIILLSMILNFFSAPLTANFLPYFVATKIRGTDYLFSSLIAPEMWQSIAIIAFSGGNVISGVIYGSFKKPGGKCIPSLRFGLALMTACFIATAACYSIQVEKAGNVNAFLVVMLIFFLVYGIALTFTNIPTSTVIQSVTAPNMLGKILGVVRVIAHGLEPLSSVAAGLILSRSGNAGLLLFCAVGLVLGVALVFLSRSIKDL